ncbi:peptide peptidase-like [Seminavis robusta]|uniref:Peptide peptidase-like n=1 Tax=Seminavis robusta TaxID=568900 RepID=A0A9N8E499_9STRA|nr:peptide peptidase-like [Seminavis robusta]|eukprot:Sro536_g162120.1 peptide peptidase-like (748) ;mRNA; r:16802-19140
MLPFSRLNTCGWTLGGLLLLVSTRSVSGILQTGSVDVKLRDGSSYTLLSSQASFGVYPAEGTWNNEAHQLMLAPSNNQLLCENVTTITTEETKWSQSTILVKRGACSFETKAWNAQKLGALGMIVYGNLGARYSLNATSHINQTNYKYTEEDIVWPREFYDYDCNKGSALVPASAIQIDPPPYVSANNDPVLSGDSSSNLCKANSADDLQNCDSKACLLTGEKDGDQMRACCAWDLHVWLYEDPAFTAANVAIPATYISMQEASRLLADYQKDDQVFVTIYSRPRPKYNISAILIWALGVFVTGLAAFMSADEYHRMIRKIIRRQKRRSEAAQGNNDKSQTHSRNNHASAPPVNVEETLELTVWHALVFVVMASSGLLILFFFKIYRVVKVFYAIGCSKAVSQIIFFPICWRIGRRMNFRDRIVWRTGTEDFGDITILDIVSHVCGFTLGFVWLVMCFTIRHPEDITFFWVVQDIFGAAMCISFLAVIKLNSLKVAASLLIMAFFYDIFMVFISPLFFGKSVMITVATSGGPPTADPAWCEKYPDDPNCQGGEPLPMLFQIPRIGDYQGGSSLLGLGDIVLPGLVVSLAARLDAAKSLLGLLGGGNSAVNSYGCPEQRHGGSGCSMCSGGYFAPQVVAYAVGLLMANMAVYLMNMGQPALLYLVPCCLGTFTFMAWRRNELGSLWEGPKAIRTVDAMLYGEEPTDSANNVHAPLPTVEGEEALTVPSASDQDCDGDVPLQEPHRNVV